MNPPDHVFPTLRKSRRSSKPADHPPPAQPPLPALLPLLHLPKTTTAVTHSPPPSAPPPPLPLPPPPPSLSDPPDVYLPWDRLVHHPAAPNLTYRVPSHLLPAPPPPAPSAHSLRRQQNPPPRLPPELDFTSPHFNPSLALATPTSDLPRGFFQGHPSFPIYDNLAQFTALTWSSGSSAPVSNDAPARSNAAHTGRLALDLSSLAASVLASPTPADLHTHWHAWAARLATVHASFHWDRMHRAIARTLADVADVAVVEREARKVRVLKAREAALELRKLLHVWELAERDDPGVVDHPRHPKWVGVNLRAWEVAGVEVPRGVDVLGGGRMPREHGVEGEQGLGRGAVGGREASGGGDDRGVGGRPSKGSAGPRGLKWSHRKRIKDVRQQ